jgi:hypothetical protein
VQEDARAGWTFHAVGFFQHGLAVHHAPNQEPLGRQFVIEALLAAILKEEILAAVELDEDFETFLRRIRDRGKDEFLLDGRIDDSGPDPPDQLLGPGAEMLRPAVVDMVGHRAPDADAFGAGIFGPGIEIGQAEHVAEFMADDADVRHGGAAFGADEIGPELAVVEEGAAMRPVEAAAIICGHAFAGVDKENAVESQKRVLAVALVQVIEGLAQQDRLGERRRALAVIAALLPDLHDLEHLAVDAEPVEGLFVVIIAQAAIHFLAGHALVEVNIVAE